MRVWAGILLVLVGLAVLLYPEYQKMQEDIRQQQLLLSLAEWGKNAENTPFPADENIFVEQKDTAPKSETQQSKQTAPLSASSKPSPAKSAAPAPFGIIEIPKIKLKLPILEGIDNKILKLGAGHFPETASPGQQGNTALAAHRSYTFGRMFNRLNELEIDDQITISRGKQQYLYQVTEIKVVEPEETSVLDQPDTGRYLTLVTCEPIRVASHRLIVRAVQIQS